MLPFLSSVPAAVRFPAGRMPRNPNAAAAFAWSPSFVWLASPWGARPYRRPSCPSSAAAVEMIVPPASPPRAAPPVCWGGWRQVRVNVDRRGGASPLGRPRGRRSGRGRDAAAGPPQKASKVSALRNSGRVHPDKRLGSAEKVRRRARPRTWPRFGGRFVDAGTQQFRVEVRHRPSWRDRLSSSRRPRQDQLRLAAATVVTAGARGDVQADQGTTPAVEGLRDTASRVALTKPWSTTVPPDAAASFSAAITAGWFTPRRTVTAAPSSTAPSGRRARRPAGTRSRRPTTRDAGTR